MRLTIKQRKRDIIQITTQLCLIVTPIKVNNRIYKRKLGMTWALIIEVFR